MNRKSPVKHKVHAYKRSGKVVRSYIRGNGSKVKAHLSNPNPLKPKGYTVTLIYSEKAGDREVQKVVATSYTRAVDEAFENKRDSRTPYAIEVVDPSIGEIIRWAGSNALKFGKSAAKMGYEVGKTVASDAVNYSLEQTAANRKGHLSGTLAQKQLERRKDRTVKQLIDEAYSSNKRTRTYARARLRKEHPDVWHVMDISRS